MQNFCGRKWVLFACMRIKNNFQIIIRASHKIISILSIWNKILPFFTNFVHKYNVVCLSHSYFSRIWRECKTLYNVTLLPSLPKKNILIVITYNVINTCVYWCYMFVFIYVCVSIQRQQGYPLVYIWAVTCIIN